LNVVKSITWIIMFAFDEKYFLIFGRVRNSTVASPPCPSGHITADKRLRYASPKLPLATSFIRKTLYDIPPLAAKKRGNL